MRMIKSIVSMMVMLAVTVVQAGDSAPFLLDTAEGTRTAREVEMIACSTAWAAGAHSGAEAVVAVNGETLGTSEGAGYVEWTPMSNGIYTLTHRVMSGGTQHGETLTATFSVERPNPDAPVISPASGTAFESSLTVSISCATEGATIYYTTDGSEPTKDSTAYRRFKIYGKTTVKAVAYDAVHDRYSAVASADYALGTCANPVIAPVGGSAVATEGGYVFYHDGQTVTIARNGDEGTIRYTLDGTDPTASSAAYSGAITLDATTTVKAKVFSGSYFDSETVTVAFVREREQVATPEIAVASTFTGSRTKCEISCATEGARIFYTMNGNAPTSHSTQYAGPFYVTDSCTVKAIALLSGCLDSEVAVKTITKEWGIGDTMGTPDHGFTTNGDGDKAFYRVADASAPHGEAMHSGDIGNSSAYGLFARTVLSTTVTGPGTVSFSWKASCEDDAPDYEWDHGEFAVDGVVEAYVSGETGWTNVSVAVTGAVEHTLTWTYLKDDAESEGEDCILVGGFGWESAEAYTHTTVVPVPYAWLTAHDPGVVDEYEAYEASAKATAANGWKVWACYALGVDPQVATSAFRIVSLPMKADGTPDLANIEFDPPRERWNVPDIAVVLKGAATLEGPWRTVTAEGGSPGTARFFKAVVFGDAPAKVQLWEGGPYWATTNIGAEKPEDYGYYFWWGDTVGYKRENNAWVASDGSSSTFSFSESNTPTLGKSSATLRSEGWITADGVLAPEHDAAQVQWGGGWRMPTKQELSDLNSKCDWTWTTMNGVNGYVIRGRGDYASNSIFLPAAGYGDGTSLIDSGSRGYYWSSVPLSGSYNYSCYLCFYSGHHNTSDYYYRCLGQSVRPVQGFTE